MTYLLPIQDSQMAGRWRLNFDLTRTHGSHASRTPEHGKSGFSSFSYEKSLVLGVLAFCTTVTLQFTKSNWARRLGTYGPGKRPTWWCLTVNLQL